MKYLLLIVAVLIVGGCTDNNGASRVLEGVGLIPLTVGGYSFFGCSDENF